MTQEEAVKLAYAYQQRCGYNTTIDETTTVTWYDNFEAVDGPVWAVEAAFPPSTFEGTDTITYIVSVDDKAVKFIINSSGFIKYPHRGNANFTDGELDELRDAGFDVLE